MGEQRNRSADFRVFLQIRIETTRRPIGRGLLLWLIGIPLPIILIIWLLGGLN
jgi:hypothetical protein